MRRPNLSPNNAEKIYAYYEARIPKLAASKSRPMLGAALLASKVVDLNLEFPEANREKMNELRQNKTGLIIASNHIHHKFDFAAFAALVDRDEDINSIARNCFVLAKVGLMKFPYRYLFEGLGAVPVFRAQDRESQAGRQSAVGSLISSSARMLASGRDMMIFPEGTTHKGGLGKIEKGIGAIACLARDSYGAQDVHILPIGLAYANNNWLQPTISIGMPFSAARDEQTIINEVKDQLLQNSQLARIYTAKTYVSEI